MVRVRHSLTLLLSSSLAHSLALRVANDVMHTWVWGGGTDDLWAGYHA